MSLDATWARAAPLLERALEHAHGTHQLADVAKAITAGQLQLWATGRSAAVSEILNFPRKRALNVFLSAGEIEDIRAALPGMMAYGQGHGCDRIMFAGRLDPNDRRRSAWEGFFPGWTPTHLSLCKELS